MRVREVRPDELAAVGSLTVAAYRADGFVAESGYAAALADAAARAAAAELLVAVDDADIPIGTVTIVHAGSRFAELATEGELEFQMLAVAPEARGRGAGSALMAAVLQRARRAGAPRVVASSLPQMSAAHRIYHRLGFRRLLERDWEPETGVSLLAFALELGR